MDPNKILAKCPALFMILVAIGISYGPPRIVLMAISKTFPLFGALAVLDDFLEYCPRHSARMNNNKMTLQKIFCIRFKINKF